MNDKFNLLALCISDLIMLVLFFTILFTQKNKTQLKTIFLMLLSTIGLWVTPLIFKILLQNTSIPPYTFECISGVGNYFTPVLFLALSNIFIQTKAKFKPKHMLLLIIPIISCILLITNDSHHLLFEHFSSDLNEIVYGKFYFVTIIYMYSLYIWSMAKLLWYMIKNSNFFSKQSLYFIIGSCIPLIINIFGTLKIIQISTYTTPITFSLTLLFYALAIFKFNFLKITPIALQKIVDKMSDGYIILNEYYNIVDYNKTLLDIFNINNSNIRGNNFFEFNKVLEEDDLNLVNTFSEKLKEIKNSSNTITFEQKINSINKFFSIELSNIYSDNTFLCILVLFKDITQHKKDMKIIQDNQSMLIEKERLATLGQMVGGIAHNLKTPIFSITGGLEGLSDLIDEYDSSIEDSTVTDDDMHAIAHDMRHWVKKLKHHVSYMSDVITAVKGQAVTLSDENIFDFTVEDLFKQVDILMKHELKNALINLNIKNYVSNSVCINGNINSLVQIINNIISNAMEAYNGKTNENIDLLAEYQDNNIIISITDYGPGIPENIQNKLFKEMITTKGKDGTGLGLFMSYSTIKANFHGEITLKSTIDVGTTFTITLPIQN